jgi:hypothetical protein
LRLKADNRTVPQIAFKPTWTRGGQAAPFKRNDRLLEIVLVGVIVSPGPWERVKGKFALTSSEKTAK